MILSPSLLSADFVNLSRDVELLKAANVKYLHVDVMDGIFVPNITIGIPVVKALRRVTDLTLDVHLMIDRPERYIDDFCKAGSDILTVHTESTPHLQRALSMIRERGKKAGAALNPSTPLSAIENVLDDLDMVLIMSVNPGFGGQKFIPQALNKIKALKEMIDESGKSIAIAVDGGVTAENIGQIVKAGAEVCVAGSATFRDGYKMIANNVAMLEDSARRA
ncbi:MAG: ribulose-phosphate 3-epimerase [Clostridia bacterium]|nr:ribulose-phosphate 3-epimerase [Clostridia bacterium]MBQ1375969.1 ribulose-phosphate 3-epimerase [Clostridia bacterium]MBQ1436071.1 ribulose-phosphate 3-epimerase [Clostridia bacterium]MBQ4249956.1 ribulose-phosphate 3-epimerase [Clostridia bacterium]